MYTTEILIDFKFFKIQQKKFAILKVWFKFAPAFKEAKNSIGPWCNGNTAVFGTVVQGSSPCGPTKVGKMPLFLERHFCFTRVYSPFINSFPALINSF